MAHTRNGRRAKLARQESARQRSKDALVAAQALLAEESDKVEEVDQPKVK